MLLSTHTTTIPTTRGSPWPNTLTTPSPIALPFAREAARGRDARGAEIALKQPTDFIPLRLPHLGKGQPRTSAHTHAQTQCTKHLFRPGLLALRAQQSFHPAHLLAWRVALTSRPPRLTPFASNRPSPSHGSTKPNRESNPGKKSILSPGNTGACSRPLPTSKHRPWQELGLAPGHQPNPGWERGNAAALLWQRRLP